MLLSRSRNSAITIILVAFLLAVPSSSYCATVFSPRRGGCWRTTKTHGITTTPQLSQFADSILVFRVSSSSSSSTQQQQLSRVLSVVQISAHENDHDNASSSLVFTQAEIQEMEKVIVSLSQISNDTVRREKLASLFDVELTNAAATATTTSGDEDGVLCPPGGVGIDDGEIPRFAKLFQVALNNIGEQVQASARKVALMTHNEDSDEDVVTMEEQQHDGRDVDDAENTRQPTRTREKSPEESQLWALVDMMVQSKTRVKMHMGKLGSKGEFR